MINVKLLGFPREQTSSVRVGAPPAVLNTHAISVSKHEMHAIQYKKVGCEKYHDFPIGIFKRLVQFQRYPVDDCGNGCSKNECAIYRRFSKFQKRHPVPITQKKVVEKRYMTDALKQSPIRAPITLQRHERTPPVTINATFICKRNVNCLWVN